MFSKGEQANSCWATKIVKVCGGVIMSTFGEKRLFVFELANNHGGSVEHGIETINQMADVARKFDFDFAFKFQYRNLETFIHKDFINRKDIKYVKRFMDTALSEIDFIKLKKTVEKAGFLSMCTPFDEKSVDKIVEQGFDIIKIASCSFTDWPLLERIALQNKPVIASSAGASIEEIDQVVSFFLNRNIDFSIMHCVGEYPTERKNLHLNQIDLLKAKYPRIKVGFSTHEEPDNVDSIKLAVGKGARIFERHVALNTEQHPINAYSSTPEQVEAWLNAAQNALEMCGVEGQRQPITDKEAFDLRGLKRGVFAKVDIKAGETITLENTYYAIPCAEGQIVANNMSKYDEYTALGDIRAHESVDFDNVSSRSIRDTVHEITESVRAVLASSGVALPRFFELELSHHYGIESFNEYGAAILNIINREYCKKLIVLLPGQKHPVHYHVKKEETFHVLYGDLEVILNEEKHIIAAGSLLTVEREDRHSFTSSTGCVFEEISTTHYINDSFYEDIKITENRKRKTMMPFTFGGF